MPIASGVEHLKFLREGKNIGLPDNRVPNLKLALIEGSQVFHLLHGLGTVLELSQDKDTVVVSTENHGIKTYRLSYVLTRKLIFVVETKPPPDSSS
jgi:hypothetical protein